MALFKKKKKGAGQQAHAGPAPLPLLGDGSGSPWYAKGEAYRGDPMDDSTERFEAAPESAYDPVDPATGEPAVDTSSPS